MQLMNKQIKYNCIKSVDKLKINGVVTISKEGFSFTGNFNTVEDSNYCGDFIYTEEEKINTSLNNIPIEYITDCSNFLLEIIKEIKSTIIKIS